MINVIFKRIPKSNGLKRYIQKRVGDAINKIIPLEADNKLIKVTVSTYNTPDQAGKDLYGIKLAVKDQNHREIFLEKRSTTLSESLSLLCDSIVETMKRASTKFKDSTKRENRKNKELLKSF